MALNIEAFVFPDQHQLRNREVAETRDRTRDLQIFSLTLSQLSYRGLTERIGNTIFFDTGFVGICQYGFSFSTRSLNCVFDSAHTLGILHAHGLHQSQSKPVRESYAILQRQ